MILAVLTVACLAFGVSSISNPSRSHAGAAAGASHRAAPAGRPASHPSEGTKSVKTTRAPALKAAAGFAVLAVSTVTSTGPNSAFQGTIIAYSSVTLSTGSSITSGRAMALNGAVTLDKSVITTPGRGARGGRG
jgi:hypothetical protein